MIKNKFPENLKSFRKEKKLSQHEISKMLGVTQQCVSEWELGNTDPTLTYLWLIADIFEISIDVLCGRKEY